MKTKIERLSADADWLMTKLSPHPKKNGVWQATVNFSGYVSLLATVSELMKLCTLAALSDEPHISPIVENSPIDVAGILELALQLMPHGKAEFLDEVRSLLSQCEPEELPSYNYSTITIMKRQ